MFLHQIHPSPCFVELTCFLFLLFFFNDTATTDIYTLSLHDALPISVFSGECRLVHTGVQSAATGDDTRCGLNRSEEHTSELQSLTNLVCRLLLEKKKPTLVFALARMSL